MIRLKLSSLFPYNLLAIWSEKSPSVWGLALESSDLLWVLKTVQQHHPSDNTTGLHVWSKAVLQSAGDFPLTLNGLWVGSG